MIYKNNNLILEIQNEFRQMINGVQQNTQQKFGKIYQGANLLWMTVYNAVRSCFGSGTWLGDKLWLGDDTWKNN